MKENILKKIKRVAAIIGIVIILGMYAVVFISSLYGTEYSQALFMAALFTTIAVPMVIYILLVFIRIAMKNKQKED